MFRFTIRDLLWLMVVVALSLGWVLERTRHVAHTKTMIAAFDESERLTKEAAGLRKLNDWLSGELRKTEKHESP